MANEKRLIDLDEAMKAINDEIWWTSSEKAYFRSFLLRQKRVDAVPVVHGRWEDMYGGKYANPRFCCSVCKEKSLFKDERNVLGNWIQVQALTPFCPHCGAALDGGNNNDI